MKDFSEFLKWEMTTRDTIDVKKIYIDMAEDILAGLMLSQIVYWHLPGRDGKIKLRVRKNGYLWLVKTYKDWWDETRLTARQARRALSILKKKGIVISEVRRFNGSPCTHIRINEEQFMWHWSAILSVMTSRAYGSDTEDKIIT